MGRLSELGKPFPVHLSKLFRLVISSKRLDAQAEAAIVKFVKLEKQEAPQEEIARVKKEADDLETSRQKNIKAFQP